MDPRRDDKSHWTAASTRRELFTISHSVFLPCPPHLSPPKPRPPEHATAFGFQCADSPPHFRVWHNTLGFLASHSFGYIPVGSLLPLESTWEHELGKKRGKELPFQLAWMGIGAELLFCNRVSWRSWRRRGQVKPGGAWCCISGCLRANSFIFYVINKWRQSHIWSRKKKCSIGLGRSNLAGLEGK